MIIINKQEDLIKYCTGNTIVFEKAVHIKCDIDVKCNISAWDITYFAVCDVHSNILCKSIKGRRENSKHFCLDGKITIKP